LPPDPQNSLLQRIIAANIDVVAPVVSSSRLGSVQALIDRYLIAIEFLRAASLLASTRSTLCRPAKSFSLIGTWAYL
jgi:hypothetical protein